MTLPCILKNSIKSINRVLSFILSNKNKCYDRGLKMVKVINKVGKSGSKWLKVGKNYIFLL